MKTEEERLVDLECRYAEVEALVETLSDVINEQQGAISRLEARLKYVEGLMSTGGGTTPAAL
jgi:uncharacterized coiled-coil protein SlyX